MTNEEKKRKINKNKGMKKKRNKETNVTPEREKEWKWFACEKVKVKEKGMISQRKW